MYNYLGAAKTFWELANPGAFFQGYAHNGFFVEVAAKRRYRSGKDFFQAFARGQLDEDLERAITFDGVNSRQWRLAYRRDEQAPWHGCRSHALAHPTALGGRSDSRLAHAESPVARQSRSGCIALGEARLATSSGSAAWLAAVPEADLWVAACHGPAASLLRWISGSAKSSWSAWKPAWWSGIKGGSRLKRWGCTASRAWLGLNRWRSSDMASPYSCLGLRATRWVAPTVAWDCGRPMGSPYKCPVLRATRWVALQLPGIAGDPMGSPYSCLGLRATRWVAPTNA